MEPCYKKFSQLSLREKRPRDSLSLHVSRKIQRESTSVDWTELPPELWTLICAKLVSEADYVRFRAVCKSWRSAANVVPNSCHRRRALHQVPFLLYPTSSTTHGFYNVSDYRQCDFKADLPESLKNEFFTVNSSFGWLIHTALMSTSDFWFNVFILYNPTLRQILGTKRLPVSDSQPRRHCTIGKAILSAEPLADAQHSSLIVIYGDQNQLAFISLDQQSSSWTYIDHTAACNVQDINVSSRDPRQLYALANAGQLLCFDLSESAPQPKFIVSTFSPVISMLNEASDISRLHYLVETCSGNMMIIIRSVCGPSRTIGFLAFELDLAKGKWVVQKTLGDNILFLGDNQSIAVSASRFPRCRPGCIYYTEHAGRLRRVSSSLRSHAFRVFDLGSNRCLEQYGKLPIELGTILPAPKVPIWVVPTFKRRIRGNTN